MEHGDRGGRKRLLYKLKTANRKEIKVNNRKLHKKQLISGFHRALLQSITFISRPNALDYTKLRS